MSEFEKEFLDQYLKLGLGSMPKSDIDALVMYLLDKYGHAGSGALNKYPNQTVSERLRTPITKVKKLRYDAALKFGGRVEDQATAKLLIALSKATLDLEGDRICLIIEDVLAKNWLQGQLKINQLIFEHSFNTEIIKVSSMGLFKVLNTCFDEEQVANFFSSYENAKTKKNSKAFKKAAIGFAKKAAEKAGGDVAKICKGLIVLA